MLTRSAIKKAKADGIRQTRSSKDMIKSSKDEIKRAKNEINSSKVKVSADSIRQTRRSKDVIKSSKDVINSSKDKINSSKDEINSSSDSFLVSYTDDENSPLKLNSQFNLSNQSALDQSRSESSLELKSIVFNKSEYMELEELPDRLDYKNVHLKEDVFYGYEEQKSSLHFLIKNAIERGESGTVLVYGGPGSGKTSFGKSYT